MWRSKNHVSNFCNKTNVTYNNNTVTSSPTLQRKAQIFHINTETQTIWQMYSFHTQSFHPLTDSFIWWLFYEGFDNVWMWCGAMKWCKDVESSGNRHLDGIPMCCWEATMRRSFKCLLSIKFVCILLNDANVGNHSCFHFDKPLPPASFLEDRSISGVLRGWVCPSAAWLHEWQQHLQTCPCLARLLVSHHRMNKKKLSKAEILGKLANSQAVYQSPLLFVSL